MERDYLERICVVDARRIRIGAAGSSEENRLLWSDDSPWIVFFTEPYETDLWRTEAVYREVLPRLCAAAPGGGQGGFAEDASVRERAATARAGKANA